MFEIITPLPSIFLVLRVSYFLSGVEILERLGRASLYLCGNEFIIKELVPQILGIFNISITISTTIQAQTKTTLKPSNTITNQKVTRKK